jgi:cytochrome c-type biogenesis protein CcmH/NrfG
MNRSTVRAAVRVFVALLAPVTALVAVAQRVEAQGAPGGPPAEVLQAQAAFNAGRADSTVVLLEAYFAANPNAPFGRLLLGNAYRQLGDFARALAAYDMVRQPPAVRLTAELGAAAMLTKLNRRGEAVVRLARVKRTGSFDMDKPLSCVSSKTR